MWIRAERIARIVRMMVVIYPPGVLVDSFSVNGVIGARTATRHALMVQDRIKTGKLFECSSIVGFF
jgi:arginine/lysine/ornithine decarboxylase